MTLKFQKMITRLCMPALLVTLCFSSTAAANPNSLGVEVIPRQIKGVWYLPVKESAQAMGYKVKWNQQNKQIEISKGANWTTVTIGKNAYFFAKMAPTELSAPPMLLNGVSLVPVEFFPHILKLNLSVVNNKYYLNGEEFAEHTGYIQKIEPGAQSKMVYISAKDKTDNYEDMTILHVFAQTLVQTELTPGKLITAQSPPIMALSLPGQTSANIIFAP